MNVAKRGEDCLLKITRRLWDEGGVLGYTDHITDSLCRGKRKQNFEGFL